MNIILYQLRGFNCILIYTMGPKPKKEANVSDQVEVVITPHIE